MTRSLLTLLALALASCTLDPAAVVDTADLTVELHGAKELGATKLKVTATLASGRAVTKETSRIGDPTVLVFEQGSVGAGEINLEAEASDAGTLLGCDGFSATVAAGDRLARSLFDTATSSAHCGTCNHRCDVAQGSRTCNAGACGPLACAAGFKDQDGRLDNGCEAATGCVPDPEDTEAACTNGRDDDCDGKADCDDPDCAALTRPCTSGSCGGAEAFACASRTWGACVVDGAAEKTPALCTDGVDNDCDGQADCDDPDCAQPQLFCNPPGTLCLGVQIWSCSTRLLSTCRLAQQTAESDPKSCADGLDNDCDGTVDCADLGCVGQKCREGSPCCVQGRCAACR